MKIDRMILADIGNTLALAKEVLRQNPDLTPPIPIFDLATAAGITDIREEPLTGMEGALITDDDKQDGVIVVNSRSIRPRRRFSVGHELGHFLNNWHKPPAGGFKCSSADMAAAGSGNGRWKMEVEANQFSAEVMMPEKLFRADLKRIPSPGLEHAVELAENRYETSKLATARRVVDLLDDPTALISSKDGVVEHIHRNNTFPFIFLSKGDAIHRKSSTATFAGNADGCSDSQPTNTAYWTNSSLKRGAEIHEQVLIQGNGYRLTLLTMDESECDDDDEQYERERSDWNPRFGR